MQVSLTWSRARLLDAKIDLALANDITAPLSLEEFARVGAKRVFDPEKVVFVPGPFHTQQGHPVRGELQDDQGVRAEIRDHQLLRGRRMRHRARAPARRRDSSSRGRGDRRGQPHLHLWGVGGFRDGHGKHRPDLRHGDRDPWLKVPESIKFVCYGKWQKWVTGKDLILYIIGRIGVEGRALRGDGIPRRSDLRTFHGLPFYHGQHGHRGGRKERHIPRGREDGSLCPGRAKRPYTVLRATKTRGTARSTRSTWASSAVTSVAALFFPRMRRMFGK